MDESKGETWRFTVHPGQAERVYLVLDGVTSPSRWIEMQRIEDLPGKWDATAQIAPGQNRLRYFTEVKGTFLNCGTAGLSGERVSDRCAAVQFDNRGFAASA